MLDAFTPASDLSATLVSLLPPIAALTTDSTSELERSGAIAPIIPATDVNTPDTCAISPDLADWIILKESLNNSEVFCNPVENPPESCLDAYRKGITKEVELA